MTLLGALRKSALCQADPARTDIVLKIDNLIKEIEERLTANSEIRNNILNAFLLDKPLDIAKILDAKDTKPWIKDDILI
jgi:hypothetical protein